MIVLAPLLSTVTKKVRRDILKVAVLPSLHALFLFYALNAHLFISKGGWRHPHASTGLGLSML